MTANLWIAGRMPGLNELIAAAKGAGGTGRFYSRLKKEWTEKIAWTALAARMPKFVGPVTMHFKWVESNRRRDPDNFCAGGRKLVNDGLVRAKVLKGDGWEHIAGWTDEWATGDEPGVDVAITLRSPVSPVAPTGG